MGYKDEIIKAMNLLAENPRVIFLGQSIAYPGHIMFGTLANVPMSKRLELPVFEETQLGICTGLALEGFIPVSIYPRMDFLVLAMNQLVNHLDKTEEMSCGQFKPKVIIRTMVGSINPMYPGPQHCQDHTEALRRFLNNIDIYKLEEPKDIVPAYQRALQRDRSSILIEMADLY